PVARPRESHDGAAGRPGPAGPGRPTARRRSAEPGRRGASGAREGRAAGVDAGVVELLLDAQELVVLVDALAAGGRAGLDLAGVDRHRQVGDRRVLGLTGTVGDHRGEAVALRERDGVEGLGEGTDLVELDQQGVRRALLDAAGEALGVGDEQVVADDLDALADAGDELAPAVPLVLAQR